MSKLDIDFFRRKKYLKVFLQYFKLSLNWVSMRVSHNHLLEFIWTILPSVILLFLAVPSLHFLNTADSFLESEDFFITVHVVGNQWFWSYEYLNEFSSELEFISFDSYMLQDTDLSLHQLRLLETDSVLVLPAFCPVRFLITSSDVLHCWAVPSLGIKVDACPGRINQIFSLILRPGDFYGQCSEICGVNHGFMPIHITAISL